MPRPNREPLRAVDNMDVHAPAKLAAAKRNYKTCVRWLVALILTVIAMEVFFLWHDDVGAATSILLTFGLGISSARLASSRDQAQKEIEEFTPKQA